MGKGGSQPTQPTSTTSTVSNLPAYIQPYMERNLQRAEGIAQEPYQPYNDQRLSVFNPDQNASFQGVRDLYNQGTPSTLQAAQSSLYGQQARMPFHMQDQWNTQRAGEYMNPYMDYVLNNVADRERLGFEQAQGARNTAAVKAGAFGGDRRFVQDEVARDAMERRLRETEASGLSNAYQSGAQQFGLDRAARLQAEGINLQGAQGLAGIANLDQTMGLNRMNALANVGAGERGLQQQLLDIGYSDFTNQRDYPRQSATWMSGIMQGVPVSPSSEVTRYEVPPNQFNQLAGLGIAGLGVANQAGWFGSGTAASGGMG